MKDIICNKCGKKILFEGDIPKEDFLYVSKNWGYFSKKDGKNYRFVICEECSDKMVTDFVVPIDISDVTELL